MGGKQDFKDKKPLGIVSIFQFCKIRFTEDKIRSN